MAFYGTFLDENFVLKFSTGSFRSKLFTEKLFCKPYTEVWIPHIVRERVISFWGVWLIHWISSRMLFFADERHAKIESKGCKHLSNLSFCLCLEKALQLCASILVFFVGQSIQLSHVRKYLNLCGFHFKIT